MKKGSEIIELVINNIYIVTILSYFQKNLKLNLILYFSCIKLIKRYKEKKKKLKWWT